MRNENLYKYLTDKCKEKGLPIESMPKMFAFSRSSLYRYMTGIIRMSPEVQAKFTQILRLDESERQEFERLVELSEFDSDMISARYALDNFVFGKPGNTGEPETIKFAYHENDTFLRTSDEIYELIRALTIQLGASCKIRIINCLESNVFISIASLLEKLFSDSENVTAEHLLTFSERAYLHNTNTLINIIPLLKYKRYSVYYSKDSKSGSAKALFGNTVIVEIHQKGVPIKYFFISFLDEDLSACLATSDKNVFAFGISNYDSFKKSFDVALLDASSIDLMGNSIAELQENANSYLLKPNICYDRIPLSVYQSMIARSSPQELENVQKGLAGPNSDTTGGLDTTLSILEKRIALSYKNRHIDTCSMNGLAEFAQTGRITDHLDFLPSFNKQERRAVLEYIRDRNNNSSDEYTLLITKEKIFENGYIMVAYEKTGVLIEYSQDDYRKGVCSNLFIKDKMLAEVISDYVKNHVPSNHALSIEEATVFLNALIESLE